jgi:guanylate kinase
MPTSREELERRLRGRKTDSEAVIERRLADALGDMSHWDEFDYVIINDDLERATAQLLAVVDGRGEASSTGNPELVGAVRNILV